MKAPGKRTKSEAEVRSHVFSRKKTLKRATKKKYFSRLLGILLIITSVLVFTASVRKRIENSMGASPTLSEVAAVRITADKNAGTLYLWGLKKGLTLKADVPVTYRYEDGFYIISIDSPFKSYFLEVFNGAELEGRFSYRPGESYPIFPY